MPNVVSMIIASGGGGGGSNGFVATATTAGGLCYASFAAMHLTRVVIAIIKRDRKALAKEVESIEEEYSFRRK